MKYELSLNNKSLSLFYFECLYIILIYLIYVKYTLIIFTIILYELKYIVSR